MEIQKETVQKSGLHSPYDKTYIDPKDPTWKMQTIYGNTKRTQKFKYLGEILMSNINEKAALKKE